MSVYLGRHSAAGIECQQLVELVTEYLDGALDEATRVLIDHHLEQCDGCTEFVAQMRQTAAVARDVEVLQLSASVRTSLLAAFRSRP